MYKIYTKNGCMPPGYIKKFLLVMKITTLLLFVGLMQVSAAGLAQKLTLVKNPVTLRQLFLEINKQTTYNVIWSADEVNGDIKINAQFKDTPLLEVLDKALGSTGLSYTITDKTILIKQKAPSAVEKLKAATAVLITIQGTVLDENNQPLIGVTVKEKGTANGTVTGLKGEYSISVAGKNAVLIFSFIGYEKQEVAAGSLGDKGIIVLKVSSTNLKEVVVNKGYYNTTKELNTGDVSSLSAKVIGEQPVSDPLAALEGHVPGLFLQQNSGVPGAGFTIRLRGINSIANGNQPLFIIDGVPFSPTTLTDLNLVEGAGVASSPFNNIPPGDIERIDVLKDADATAIYGSRGANGVVLITTKKGQAGGTKVDLSAYTGVGTISRKMDLLNTDQYLLLRHEAFKNDGVTPQSSDYDVNGAWDTTRYTDWQKVLIGGTARMSNYSGSISGGNESTQFFLGSSFENQTTVYPGNFGDQRASVHANISNISGNKKFRSVFTASYSTDTNILPESDLTSFITLPPDAPPIYASSGQLNWQQSTWVNPFAALLQKTKVTTENLLSSLDLSYSILPQLQVKVNLSYNSIQANQLNTVPLSSYNPQYQPFLQAEADVSHNQIHTWNIEPQINYEQQWGKNHFGALLGSTLQETKQDQLGQVGLGFTSDALLENIQSASTVIIVSDANTDYRYSAAYARLNYNYDDKYILNLTGRRDGSSRFGPSERIANFGAVGAGWIFSKETFSKSIFSFLSFGKIRASYGLTGNDQIGNYQYLSTYTSGTYPYQGLQGLNPARLANPNYGWEVNRKIEAGLETAFLNDRIQFDLSYYSNRSSNQLVASPLPAITGFTSIIANLPATVQNTGWEFEIGSSNIKSANFSWRTSLNLTIPSNKLLAFPNLAGSGYANRYEIGQSLNIVKVYHETGVDPQTGAYLFEKLSDHSNTPNPSYPNDLISVDLSEKFYGGMQNTVTYKQFELNVFFQFVKQKGRNYVSNFALPGGVGSNQPEYVLNRWQNPGDNKPVQRFSQDYGSLAGSAYSNYYQNSDASIGDASFIRLKNLSIDYAIPNSTVSRWGIKGIKLFLRGENLFIITRYQGLDPENKGPLPLLRILTTGFTISL